jgi:hypothetical protein
MVLSVTPSRFVDAYADRRHHLQNLRAVTQAHTPSDSPYMALKLSSDVISMKRRASTLGSPPSQSPEDEGGDDDNKRREEDEAQEERAISGAVDLSPLQRAIREPGAYVSSGTSLSVHVELQNPMPLSPESARRLPRSALRLHTRSPPSISAAHYP